MFVSGVIASAILVGILVVLFLAGVALAYVDGLFNKHRKH